MNGVDFVAHFGEVLFIVGPSGILRPNAGAAGVNGDDIWTLTNSQLADFRLNRSGFFFQEHHLFPRLTSAENVAIPLILKHLEWNDPTVAANKYLQFIGLKDRSEILQVKLSGGEQQRVAMRAPS